MSTTLLGDTVRNYLQSNADEKSIRGAMLAILSSPEVNVVETYYKKSRANWTCFIKQIAGKMDIDLIQNRKVLDHAFEEIEFEFKLVSGGRKLLSEGGNRSAAELVSGPYCNLRSVVASNPLKRPNDQSISALISSDADSSATEKKRVVVKPTHGNGEDDRETNENDDTEMEDLYRIAWESSSTPPKWFETAKSIHLELHESHATLNPLYWRIIDLSAPALHELFPKSEILLLNEAWESSLEKFGLCLPVEDLVLQGISLVC
ncbi:hypothetical protein BDR26DRAFT_552689 [Obelidium mucronatum]|nr:hypothetical protein BDR26DRAFT_552689 [Obelidium mucronatum]